MPNSLTHYAFALEVKDGLKEELKQIIEKNKQAFIIGAQGPDLMFAMNFEKDLSLKRFGNDLQDKKMYEMFGACRDYLKADYSESVHAYLLGYLTHYALDKNAHAYVNFYVFEKLPPLYPVGYDIYLHRLHEVGLDTYVAEEKLKLQNHKVRVSKLLKADTQTRKMIAKIHVRAIAPVFEKDTLTEKKVLGCFTKMHIFLTAVHNKRKNNFHRDFLYKLESLLKMKRELSSSVRPLHLPADKDFLNLKRDPWKKIFNEEERVTETFDEMFDRAKDEAYYYIKMFQESFEKGTELIKSDFTVNYEGVRIGG